MKTSRALAQSAVHLSVFLSLLIGWTSSVFGQEQPRLEIELDGLQKLRLSSPGSEGVYRLEDSDDLALWNPFAVAHDGLVRFPDARLAVDPVRYYRLNVSDKTPEDDWTNQLALDNDDAFLSPPPLEDGVSRWIKFAILLDAPHKVIFQDSTKYSFHFDFATRRLPGFENVDPITFDRLTLQTAGQEAVLGAVVLAPNPDLPELGIQFAGSEPIAPQAIADWFDLVREFLVLPPGASVFYFPSFEQSAATVENAAFFADRRIPISSAARWAETDQCYSEGWAFGKVVVLDAGSIDPAYADGRLTYADILVTDAVPAEIPPVAGLITLAPATPNSHVAILSKSFRIPFAFLARQADQARVQSWAGQEVILLASVNGGNCSVSTFNVNGQLSASQRDRLSEAKKASALAISPIQSAGSLILSVDGLTPGDIEFAGGKAANFGFLRRAIPDASPDPALVLTFDLWTEFMGQTLPDGKEMGEAIREKLSVHQFPPDIAAMRKDLTDIRELIKTEGMFSEEQRSAVLAALEPFDANRKIRFRSSTNVEDSDQFVGAGLYDSFSGCVADDTDANDDGPSHCDPKKDGERGVFRAIRKVFASFYNDNAFLERLRHGVDETAAGMAVLVHHSFPDEIEFANGVATIRVTKDGNALQYEGELVTQAGAASVANPDSNALPEIVSVLKGPALADPSFTFDQRSGLVPLGGTVLEQGVDYPALFTLLEKAAVAFLGAVPNRTEVLLDFEYKKVDPSSLIVKQIREIPQIADGGDAEPPFVLNDIGQLDVFQHHGKDLFANYRLKSVWNFQALQFEDVSIGSTFDFVTDVQYHDGQSILNFNGTMSGLPDSKIEARGKKLSYMWSWGEGDAERDYTMEMTFPNSIEGDEIVALSEATLIELSVDYAIPQPRISSAFQPEIDFTNKETTRMVSLEAVVDGTIDRDRSFEVKDVTVTAAYTLGFLDFFAPGIGIFDSKSFPLVKWNAATTIKGLTSQPIVLEGHYSRTYDSNRHNFFETFLLVPHLEPRIDPEILAELQENNIQGIIVSQFTADQNSKPTIHLWGFDDSIREG